MSFKVYSTNSNKVLDVEIASEKTDYQYPKAFFEKNGHQAPDCRLYTITGATFTGCEHCSVYDTVLANYNTETFSLKDAKLLLNSALDLYSEKELGTWKSFEYQIVTAGVVKPNNLLKMDRIPYPDVTTRSHEKPKEGECAAAVDKMSWLILAYLAPYRMHNINPLADDAYRSSVLKKIVDMAKTLNGASTFDARKWTSNMDQKTNTWIEDVDYCRAVAALDMFFSKYKTNKYSRMRVCTLTSRLRDSATLNEILWYSSMTKKTMTVSVSYMMTQHLVDDLNRVFEEGNELLTLDSYTYYASSMGLVMTSPYSAKANPNLHHFINLFGACCNETRAMHSQVFEPAAMLSMLDYTMFLAYIIVGSTEIELLFAESEEEKATYNRLKAQKVAAANEIVDGNAVKTVYDIVEEVKKEPKGSKIWEAYTIELKNVCPEYIRKVYMHQWESFDNATGRTCLGQRLKDMASAYLKANKK